MTASTPALVVLERARVGFELHEYEVNVPHELTDGPVGHDGPRRTRGLDDLDEHLKRYHPGLRGGKPI